MTTRITATTLPSVDLAHINNRFVEAGGRTFLAPPPHPTFPVLGPNTYSVGFDPDAGIYYLTQIDDFTLPAKIYGHNTTYANTILETFLERQNSITTAALSGQKGSGKTLTAKEISILGRSLGIPTLEVSSAFAGAGFNRFLQNIRQPCIVFIDEFEKVYNDEENRNRLLGLLDGPYKTHKLVLLTMNKKLDNGNFEYFHNRPGRVYYNIPYGAVTEEILKEYCADHLIDQSQLNDIQTFAKRFSYFTLDMLTVLVKEKNKTGWTCDELSAILNLKPDLAPSQMMFEAELLDPNDNPVDIIYSSYGWESNPAAAVIEYGTLVSILSGSCRNISLQLRNREEFDMYRKMYVESRRGELSMDTYFDETGDLQDYADDPEGLERVKKCALEYETNGKARGRLKVRFDIDEPWTEAAQDPVTRAVTVKNCLTGHKLIIRPAGKAEERIRFQF